MRIGPLELVVIFVVALLVIGPDKLPEYARKLGKAMGEFSKASKNITDQINKEVVEPMNEAAAPIKNATEGIRTSAEEITNNINNIGKVQPEAATEQKAPEKTQEKAGTDTEAKAHNVKPDKE